MQRETIDIFKIVNGGYGVGKLTSGQIVLVHHVLPGETVTVNIIAGKKNSLSGHLQQIESSHPARRSPPCPYFGHCGGCDLQHGGYAEQLSIKTAVLRDLLQRTGKGALDDALPLLAKILPAPQEFGYRQRLRLQVDNNGRPGFHRLKSHEVIPVKACLLGGTAVNHSLACLLGEESSRRLVLLSSEIEVLLNPRSGKTLVIFRMQRKPRPADILAAHRFAEITASVERVFFSGEKFSIMGPFGRPEELPAGKLLGIEYPALAGLPAALHLSWEAGGFSQVNLMQNRYLIETVTAFCEIQPGQTVLDLYCGMGNFAVPLALLGAEVTGIEGQGSAIRSAAANAEKAGTVHARFEQAPIHQACRKLVARGRSFDCVVIDPPRAGAPNLAAELASLTRQRLVYISCDPATLCRDLVDLLHHGFSIEKIQPIDMFPQTHHVETVVLLRK